MHKQRARSAEDKQERRAQILGAALELWGERTFASYAMAEVAVRAGLAKGTLYLYFETKEALLLALLEAQLAGWFDALDAGLEQRGAWDVVRAAGLLCGALDQQPALVRLLPIAASILEHNIAPPAALAYKEFLLARSAHSAALLESRLPFLAGGGGVTVLLNVYALIVGLGQMADPAPVVAAVLAEERMAPLRVAFAPALRQSVTALLRGLAAGAS